MFFPGDAAALIRALNAEGFEAYAVGGCVRDSLLGITPNDWDITTSAKPDDIKRCFKDKKVVETGVKHGTVTVVMDKKQYEITTYRLDGAYTDHRRPDKVEFVSDLSEDLMRRDFTINAMACHPDTGVADLFGGRRDLENKLIRCVGAPEKRFEEDALRILRALRFASVYDFAIDASTARAARTLAPTLKRVSAERVFIELKKLLCGKGARRILTEFPEVLFEVLPELKPMHNFPQHTPHHAYDVWTHTAITVENAPAEPMYRLTMLLHDAGKPEKHTTGADGRDHFYGHPLASRRIAEEVLLRLKSDKATLNEVCRLVLEHDLRAPATRAAVRKQMARLGSEFYGKLLKVLYADLMGQNPSMRAEKLAYADALARFYREALAENACLRVADLNINGLDIKALGVKGAQVGQILNRLLDMVISEKLENERAALLGAAKSIMRNMAASQA